jgi:hypothetical protein
VLAALALHPRPAGSPAEARARERCAERLRELGFAVREEPFGYSALPGRWGTPAAGVLAAGVLVGAARLGPARPAAALLLLAGAGLALLAIGRWTARHGVLVLPLLRERSTNLVAVRGGSSVGVPRVWLVAHLDSKSQPVPIGLRAAGIVATAAVWLGAALVAGAQLLGLPAAGWWGPLAAAGTLAAVPVALTTVGARSDGAVDNASGVAAVLDAAARLPADAAVGVLLTSAEELGLAGARAWARTPVPTVALNCDGVDDEGELVAMYSGRAPEAVLRALDAAAGRTGQTLRARRLVPGILTDGVALADAGWAVATVSRGTRATLRRIHTPRDDLARLKGRGIEPTGRLLAAAAAALAGAGPSPSDGA